MKTINFVLIKSSNNGYYFSNPKTGSENEIFFNKMDGVNILLDYLDNEKITKCRALELIDQITSIMELPVTKKVNNYQLSEDVTSLLAIVTLKKHLQEFSVTETEDDLPKLKMCHCDKHGRLIGKEFISIELLDKESVEQVVEELLLNAKINWHEREKILSQLEKTILPEKATIFDPRAN